MNQAQHIWFYCRDGLLNEIEEGPFTEAQLIELIKTGKIKLKTKLRSPTRTNNALILANSNVKIATMINQAKLDLEAKKEAERQAALEAKKESKKETDAVEAVVANASDESSNVASIRSKINGILTTGETIDLICVQTNPVAIYKDAVVCTSRRLILFHPKMLGRYEFEDFLWMDLSDAHLKQEMIGSTFTAKHVSGRLISMGWLSKEGARSVYRHAQQMEERAFFRRRELEMEERAAGATKISFNDSNGNPSNQTAPAVAAPDVTSKLKKLKEMLELELISQDEFNAKKQQLLAEL